MIDSILNIFEQYGWYGILGLLVAGGIFLLIKWGYNKISKNFSSDLEQISTELTRQMSEQNNKLTEGLSKISSNLTDQISKQNEQLVSTIITQQERLFDHLINRENDKRSQHIDMIKDKMHLSNEINDTIKTIMYSHNAQRIFILEFHNTYENLTGIPFAKYSCTYEWFEKGLTPLTSICRGLPFAQISSIVSDILKNESNQVIYNNIDELEENNPALVVTVKDDRTKALLYNGLYDKNNILIGLLGIEYQKEHKLTKEELNQLSVQCAELTSIINIRYKYENKNKDNK